MTLRYVRKFRLSFASCAHLAIFFGLRCDEIASGVSSFSDNASDNKHKHNSSRVAIAMGPGRSRVAVAMGPGRNRVVATRALVAVGSQ